MQGQHHLETVQIANVQWVLPGMSIGPANLKIASAANYKANHHVAAASRCAGLDASTQH
jgi:hypothetical protein